MAKDEIDELRKLLGDASVGIRRDMMRGLTLAEIEVKYADIIKLCDEIERVNDHEPKLRRIK